LQCPASETKTLADGTVVPGLANHNPLCRGREVALWTLKTYTSALPVRVCTSTKHSSTAGTSCALKWATCSGFHLQNCHQGRAGAPSSRGRGSAVRRQAAAAAPVRALDSGCGGGFESENRSAKPDVLQSCAKSRAQTRTLAKRDSMCHELFHPKRNIWPFRWSWRGCAASIGSLKPACISPTPIL